MFYPDSIANLIAALQKLPGVGPKTAQRLAFFILTLPRDEVVQMARALVNAKDKTHYCRIVVISLTTSRCNLYRSTT